MVISFNTYLEIYFLMHSSQIFLNKERQKVPLQEKIQLSHDTFLYRFALPQSNSVLGLPVGKHFKIYSPNKVGSTPGQWNGLQV